MKISNSVVIQSISYLNYTFSFFKIFNSMRSKNIITSILFNLLFLSFFYGQEINNTTKNSFVDFSLSMGKSGWYFGESGPERFYRHKDIGLGIKVGTKWELKDLSPNYNLGIQCNWFRSKAAFSIGTLEYVWTGVNTNMPGFFQFDVSLFNIGLVNQIKFGKSAVQLNFNTGPTLFNYSQIGVGWVVDPEVKFFYNNLYLSIDYSIVNILYRDDSYKGMYRNYASLSIGKNIK
jgi:hypothetical protein